MSHLVLLVLFFWADGSQSLRLLTGSSYFKRTLLAVTTEVTTISSTNGAWLPVCSISSIGNDLPTRIELAGEKYALWKHGDRWSLMRDICPHRAAPLSQGRVDKMTGCIECPYHGWQFEVSGKCTKVPQQSDTDMISQNLGVESLPTYVTGDFLFAFTPLPPGQASYYPILPDELYPVLRNVSSVTVRELPYSFDFLLENFMDPAHVPFAHHKLQGTRDDACPIPMKVLTSIENSTHCEVTFKDIVRGKERDGVLSFAAPSYFHFRVTNPSSGQTKIPLFVLVAPVAPGRCRVFVCLFPGMKLPLPRWFLHANGNKFLDSDIWVHDQERFVRQSSTNTFLPSPPAPASKGATYALVTESDTGCRLWRKWWGRHMKDSPIFGPALHLPPWEREREQLDYYEAHLKHCASCRDAVANARRFERWSLLLALLPIATSRSVPVKVAGIIAYGIAQFFSRKTVRMISGPEPGDKTSAPQLFE